MGVPKFYRFISDRYPCINKTVKEHEIPQYDNLYLDMNSIIHTCSHPTDSDIHFRIGKKEFSDEDIFQNVCRYVEIIFSIVKPVDLMYLAFDGVAPRAKMNQQRGHRFRAAKDMNEALVKNEMLQEDKLFDANCITTGTVFMAELIDHMKHFVAYKVSTDPGWQKCKIIVSGPEVPGEGEHKIMEYIRFNKAQTNYNPNTRHCLYCLDADLIILGLCTHEPHFSLIREKVTFGKRMNMLTPEESDFELLHLSLLREYLEYEFTPIKTKLNFPFDLEKIIDDWVLIGFLVGNDFIPQLPNLNIVHGALPLLYQAYMEVLPTLDGYMNEFGELNVKRFKTYLHRLSKFETKLTEPCKLPEFLANGTGSESRSSKDDSEKKVPGHKLPKLAINLSESCKKPECSNIESEPEENSLKDDSKIEKPVDNKLEQTVVMTDEEKRKILIANAFKALSLNCDDKKEDSVDKEKSLKVKSNTNNNNEKELVESPISNPLTEEYYKIKFKFDPVDRSKIVAIVEQYIKAIQWTLKYYYQGCCSWSWYYPYHYAPLISDFNEMKDFTFDFTMGNPFLPLQHLLAVLPPANVHLLPKALQCLLTNQNSPIIEFYPEEFEVDLNGKTNDWESIVLIPFIDENKLLKAMEPYIKNLGFKDRKRNTNGSTCIFTHTKNSLGQYPVETIFDSFENHAQLEHIKVEDMHLPKNKLVQGLCSKVSFNISFPGFPTLKHVLHSFKRAQAESKFNTHRPAQIERMVLRVTAKPAIELANLAEEFLGKKVYAYWPYLHEAFVIGVIDFKQKIILKNFWKGYNEDNVKIEELTKPTITNLHANKRSLTEMYKDTFGIEIGKTDILFLIFSKIGECYTCMSNGKVQLQTKWSPLAKVFPYQLIVKDEEVQRHNFILYKSMNDLFTNSSACFMISQPNYGAKGEIKNVIEKKQLIAVTLEVPEEPDFSSFSKELFAADSAYMNCNEVAKQLKVSPTLISRITGSLIVSEEPITTKYHDVGLRIKFPKHDKELFGYTKKNENVWTYSEKALEVIRSYMNNFPYIFENVDRNMKDAMSSTFAVSDLFPDGLSQLNLLKVWLSEQKAHYTTFLECHTQTLGVNGVPALEKLVAEFYSTDHKQITTTSEVKPQFLFIPGTLAGLVPPDFKAEHKLLDRIVCVKSNFTVPLGLKGTIIGIQKKEEKCKYVYEVLFDSSFTGGLTLYESSEHRCYRLMGTDFVNISFGRRDVSNLRRARADAPFRMNNQNRRPVDNANLNKHNGSQSNQANRSSGSFQAKNHNVRPKKAYTPTSGSKASIDCNGNKPINSGNNAEQNKANSDGSKNFKNYDPKRPKKPMSQKSMVSNGIDNRKQETECIGETLNEESVNDSQHNDTKSHPKVSFKKNYKQKRERDSEKIVDESLNASQQNKTGTRPKIPFKKNYKEKSERDTDKIGDESPSVSEQHSTETRPTVPSRKNYKQKNESIGEKLIEESDNAAQANNKSTRPKQPYNKKNGFKNQKNEYTRNTNAKKNATNKNKTVKQCQPNNTMLNPDADKKSCDSKEDKHE